MPGMQWARGKHVADVEVPHHSARWLAEEAEPGGNGRSSGSVYCNTLFAELVWISCCVDVNFLSLQLLKLATCVKSLHIIGYTCSPKVIDEC